ncbi:MAG: hypothetical protein R6U40_02675 [Desulfobacterales bacterium]
MCDIFAISAGYKHTPKKYLPVFAEKGKQNMNGWGIGFFRDDQAFISMSISVMSLSSTTASG